MDYAAVTFFGAALQPIGDKSPRHKSDETRQRADVVDPSAACIAPLG
jgi:hypothetical protein